MLVSTSSDTESILRTIKGPWTANEDIILTAYVMEHGEGQWNLVQRNTGLRRCGKSCRLRWANHLRPDLKKGSFTEDEEALVVTMHANFGNKWAKMAAQLPGRTDNEIKNFWNTRTKRRMRAGLPPHSDADPSLSSLLTSPDCDSNIVSSSSITSSPSSHHTSNTPLPRHPTTRTLPYSSALRIPLLPSCPSTSSCPPAQFLPMPDLFAINQLFSVHPPSSYDWGGGSLPEWPESHGVMEPLNPIPSIMSSSCMHPTAAPSTLCHVSHTDSPTQTVRGARRKIQRLKRARDEAISAAASEGEPWRALAKESRSFSCPQDLVHGRESPPPSFHPAADHSTDADVDCNGGGWAAGPGGECTEFPCLRLHTLPPPMEVDLGVWCYSPFPTDTEERVEAMGQGKLIELEEREWGAGLDNFSPMDPVCASFLQSNYNLETGHTLLESTGNDDLENGPTLLETMLWEGMQNFLTSH